MSGNSSNNPGRRSSLDLANMRRTQELEKAYFGNAGAKSRPGTVRA